MCFVLKRKLKIDVGFEDRDIDCIYALVFVVKTVNCGGL